MYLYLPLPEVLQQLLVLRQEFSLLLPFYLQLLQDDWKSIQDEHLCIQEQHDWSYIAETKSKHSHKVAHDMHKQLQDW